LEDLKVWLKNNQSEVLKGSLTRKAINCTLNQWDRLIRYIDGGSTPISNILSESAIWLFCVGRRNGLFSDTTPQLLMQGELLAPNSFYLHLQFLLIYL
jgi:hypothetical protein